MHVTLRPAVASDRAFVEAVYFETQRWIIERLFGWRGDEVERAKFDETYSERESEIVVLDGSNVGWLSVRRDADGIDIDAIYLLPACAEQRYWNDVGARGHRGGSCLWSAIDGQHREDQSGEEPLRAARIRRNARERVQGLHGDAVASCR